MADTFTPPQPEQVPPIVFCVMFADGGSLRFGDIRHIFTHLALNTCSVFGNNDFKHTLIIHWLSLNQSWLKENANFTVR